MMRLVLCLFVLVMVSSIASARTLDGAYPMINSTERAMNLVYNPDNGGLHVVLNSGENGSAMKMLTSLQINSMSAGFGGRRPENLTGEFDIFRSDRLFKMDTGGFGPSIDFGTPLTSGRTVAELMQNITVAGSFLGGGSVEQLPFNLIHPAAVPEPCGLLMACVGTFALMMRRVRLA